MARKVRLFVENASQHILLKSLNGLTLFKEQVDYEIFKKMLLELSIKHQIEVHSYVLMPLYFEFLVTPPYIDSLSKFMQSLGRKYVGYFNKKYNRLGTLFEGRYKASIVEDVLYLFEVMIYIEQAPLRENLVSDAKDYLFSSVHKNLYKKSDKIISYHQLYKELGVTDDKRVDSYLNLFNTKNIKDEFIRLSLEKQLITGSEEFVKQLEKLVGMTLSSKNRGRPKKQNTKQRKTMYKNLVVLDKEKHKELKLNPLENLMFAKQTQFIPIIASEVAQIGANYPVVFSSDEEPALISLVSLGGDSLAISEEGKWLSPYLPSFLRKYPFSLASTKENPEQKVILIDEDAKVFSKSKGKQLFKKNGDHSEILTNAINYLTEYEKQATITKNVAKLISDAEILEDREISVGEGDEKKVLVAGFKVVNRDKLNALSDDILADWVRKGIINMIDAHLKSLDNIQGLFNIVHQRQS